MDAFQDGAVSMLALVGAVVSISFVFVAYISWINKTLTWFGDRVGIDDLTIEVSIWQSPMISNGKYIEDAIWGKIDGVAFLFYASVVVQEL